MSEFGPNSVEATGQPALLDEERNVIFKKANLRKLSAEFRAGLLKLEEPTDDELKLKFVAEKAQVQAETEGQLYDKFLAEEKLNQEEEGLKEKAETMMGVAPNLTAYLCAELAKLQMSAERDFEFSYQAAEKALVRSRDLPRNTPSSMLPEAILIGLNKKSLENAKMPSMDKMAQASLVDSELLRSIALVLSEEERTEFLAQLPEGLRAKASAAMDKELSSILKEKIIIKEELPQRDAVRYRSAAELSRAIESLSPDFDQALIKELSKTLAGLEDEDSIRLMQNIGEQGLTGKKDERRHKTRLIYAARIVRELGEIDQAKGGNLAMKFLAKKEVRPMLFHLFSRRLIQSEYLTANLEKYLEDDKNLPFLRKLMAENPNQFNTVLDTVSQISDYEPAEHQEEIFQALQDLDALTPIIFDRYRQADSFGKKELSVQIRDLKPKFFRNLPIKNILSSQDRDILVEMVYLSYRPIGMSFNRVRELIDKLEDRTEDLENYKFPEDGYDFTLSSQRVFALKEGEMLNIGKLRDLKELFGNNPPETEEEIKELSLLFNNLIKGKTGFTGEERAKILSLIGSDELIENFRQRYQTIGENNSYNYLTELKEILGIYFKDHYSESLNGFLSANPDTERELLKIMVNPKRQEFMRRQLGKQAEEIDWENFDRSNLSRMIADFLFEKVLKSSREEISGNLKKFVVSEQGEQVLRTAGGLKAFISKNIGSFFAKAAAGICTAEDIPLFEREDHFHLNVVENDESVRANIQVYIIKDAGGQSLVLRGFNPTVDFLEKIDVGSFCEKVIDIGKQFVRDNAMKNVYITEQGGWHALSNREQATQYLSKKYHKDGNRKHYSLRVASGASVDNIYEV